MILATSRRVHVQRQAWQALGLFTIFGLFGLWRVSAWTESFGLVIFYAALVVNTFFSVRCFSAITPPLVSQRFVDAVLVLFYGLLAFQFSSPIRFTAVATLLFAVSAIKYAWLSQHVTYHKLLQRKFRVNSAGVFLCLAAFLGIASGFPFLSTTVLVLGYLTANFYLLLIRPLYVLDQ